MPRPPTGPARAAGPVDAARRHRWLRCRAGPRKELRTPADDRLSRTWRGRRPTSAPDTPAHPAHRHRARAVRALPVPDRRGRDGPRGAAQAGQRHPPAARRAAHRTGPPSAGHPRRDVADLLIADPAEIRSRPASTTQETIVNTDIHPSRSGFGHRRRSRRNVDRAACGAVGRSRGQLRGTGLQILHAAPYVTHPPPTSGGNAPIRSSPTPTPSPSSRTRGAALHGHHGGRASAVAARRVRLGRAARGRNGWCRPLCGRRHRIDGVGGQRAASSGSSSSADAVTCAARTGRSWSASTT